MPLSEQEYNPANNKLNRLIQTLCDELKQLIQILHDQTPFTADQLQKTIGEIWMINSRVVAQQIFLKPAIFQPIPF
jgi:hypothetical protein